MVPRIPDESARLAALKRLEILDTRAEPAFDDLATLAAHLCQTSIGFISFIDADRQWFKAAHGVAIREIPRRTSFCQHTIAQTDIAAPLEIRDARLDSRFQNNPLVTTQNGVRFYAGVSLLAGGAHAVGTLCVVDRSPRELNETQTRGLIVLGQSVVAHLEVRRSTIAGPATCEGTVAHPIDADSLLRRHEGKTAVIEKLIFEFQAQIGKQLNSLRRDLACRDAQHLMLLANAIEGTASDLSAEPLRDSAHHLEASVLANDFEAAAAWLTHLEAEARECIDYLPTAAAAVKRSTTNE